MLSIFDELLSEHSGLVSCLFISFDFLLNGLNVEGTYVKGQIMIDLSFYSTSLK